MDGAREERFGAENLQIRPHEFRDTLATWASNVGVPEQYFNFVLGHEIDLLKYDKSPNTPKGEQNIREALELVRGDLNIITGRSEKAQVLTGQKVEIDELRAKVDQLTIDIPRILEAASKGVLLPLPAYLSPEERKKIKAAKQALLPDKSTEPTSVETAERLVVESIYCALIVARYRCQSMYSPFLQKTEVAFLL